MAAVAENLAHITAHCHRPGCICRMCESIRGKVRRSVELGCPSRKEYARDWARQKYQKNPEAARERQRVKRSVLSEDKKEKYRACVRKSYWANREERLAKHRLYLRNNQEQRMKARTRKRRWAENNQDKLQEQLRTRKARRFNAAGFCSAASWLYRVIFYGWRCRYCGCQLDRNTLTCDHRIALSRGGTAWPSNLVPACLPCNMKKHDKTEKEFLLQLATGGGDESGVGSDTH